MSNFNKQAILLRKNTISSLAYQLTTVICGFIVPRLVLSTYGSEVNGLVSSIKQFLGIIALLELGVGAVVQSTLYKPIAEENTLQINKIVTSANRFFSKIGFLLVVYISILIFVYPMIINTEFDWFYTVTLIIAIGISYFAQYYFGVVDRLFLNSAQHGYVQYNTQSITLILNAVACFILINLNCSIQVFQLVSSFIFLSRPIYLRYYINKHYNLNYHTFYDKEPISQKWDGIAQHTANVVLNDTDVIVLTILSSLSNVSIYSVYYLVLNGVKSICYSLTSGIEALEGELWAKKELKDLTNLYKKSEWIIHMITVIAFSCTMILIVPFVQVYTMGVSDVNYVQPLFGNLMTLAISLVCFRLPYAIMILVAGHYKETKICYIKAALLNISISILAVYQFELIGVAIGTLIALGYQTIWMAKYCSKNLVFDTGNNSLKLFGIDILCIVLINLVSSFYVINNTSYILWGLDAMLILTFSLIITFLVNYIFYREYVFSILNIFINRFKKIKLKI